MQANVEAGVIRNPERRQTAEGKPNLALDDYPGLKPATTAPNEW